MIVEGALFVPRVPLACLDVVMSLSLHNPMSQAHIEDLKDRLRAQLAPSPLEEGMSENLVEALAALIRAMDRGAMSVEDVEHAFGANRVPGFSFGRWLGDMLDEGVYVEQITYGRAA
jgi:response regulator of citrate/malate metabolism